MPSENADSGQREWQSSTASWSLLRQAARENRSRATPAEVALWEQLRNRGLGGFRFRRQHAIGRFIVDFYCIEAGLVIEVDGPIHLRQTVEDAEREAELELRGLRVIRFRNDEVVQETASVLERIATHLTPSPSPTSEGNSAVVMYYSRSMNCG